MIPGFAKVSHCLGTGTVLMLVVYYLKNIYIYLYIYIYTYSIEPPTQTTNQRLVEKPYYKRAYAGDYVGGMKQSMANHCCAPLVTRVERSEIGVLPFEVSKKMTVKLKRNKLRSRDSRNSNK